MPLSDLQTDLTSLKYGSKLPAVRHKMGNKVSQVSARIDDVKRLAVILTQAPGRKFAANQILLQNAKIGSAISGKDSLGKAVLAGLGAAFKASVGTGVFLTANAAKAGTGYHSINPSVAMSYLDKAAMDKFMDRIYIENVWCFSKDKNRDIFKYTKLGTLEEFI